MSRGQTLSAVARRRAAKLDNSSTLDSSQVLPDAVASVASPSIISSLPVKRKTSAQFLEAAEISRSLSNENQSRRNHKAPKYSQAVGAIEIHALPSSSPQRAYSPSQPLPTSSDEGGVTSPPTELETSIATYYRSEEHDSPTRTQGVSRKIFDLVDGQNCFTITSEHAFLITRLAGTAKILLMNDEDSLLFVGAMRLMLLQGSIRLLGVPLSPSTTLHRVFAPRTHPVPVLEVLADHGGTPSENSLKTNPSLHPLLLSLPEYIRKAISATHTVAVVQELSTGVEGLGRIVQSFASVFEPDVREMNFTEEVLKGLYTFKAEPRFDSIFYLPTDWQSAIDSIISVPSSDNPEILNGQAYDAPIILVKGPKNSGKSTFSRTLANCLTNSYRRVAFIECDLGQSEFTPGGIVSLNVLTSPVLGPPFTHLSQPRYAHFIGGSSPKTSPSHYLSALNDLAQRYQLELKYTTASDYDIVDELEPLKNSTVIPLVINTQGWIKGMGADLLRSIEELFGPTHIVEFQLPQTPSSLDVVHDRPIPIVESIAHNICDTSRHTITLLPIFSVSRPPRFSAADLRSLAFASYFYGRFPTSSSSNGDSNGFIIHWDTSLSLRSVAPIVIDTRSALESIVIVAPAGDDVVPEELPRALICGVVGLVAPDSPSTPPGITYIQGALPPAPQVSRCVGLGFIRGASNTQLHLLTPAPVHLLRLCRTIVLGELFMPVWAFLELDGNNAEESGIPFLQWGRSIAENAGGERRRIRRNIMRRGRS